MEHRDTYGPCGSEESDNQWYEAKLRYRRGTIVTGIVVRQESHGVYVKLPEGPFLGIVELPSFVDEGRMTIEQLPQVGTSIEAVALGPKESVRQIWFSMKPSELAEARENQRRRLEQRPTRG